MQQSEVGEAHGSAGLLEDSCFDPRHESVDRAVQIEGPVAGAHDQFAAHRAVLVGRAARLLRIVHGERHPAQVAGSTAPVLHELRAQIRCLEDEVAVPVGEPPGDVERRLEVGEGRIVVDPREPLRGVEAARSGRRRREVQDHGDDRVIVQHDLAAGPEQQMLREHGRFTDPALRRLHGFGAQGIDQATHGGVVTCQAEGVENQGHPVMLSTSRHPTSIGHRPLWCDVGGRAYRGRRWATAPDRRSA